MSGDTRGTTVEVNNDGNEAVAVGSEAYQELSVREQIEVLDSADEVVRESDTESVSGPVADPEDYLLDSHRQVDVVVDGEAQDEKQASLEDIRNAHEEAEEERTRRCGMDIEKANEGSRDVSTPEKILGRTVGETYLVMGEGLPMGALVQFETITKAGTYEEGDALRGSALSKNDVSDVFVEARVTMVEGRENLEIVTEGDLDVEDTSEAEGVKTVAGPGQILVEETLLDEIPDDAKWFVQ